MTWKWPRRKKYGHPRIELPLKDALGNVVGVIFIEGDTFTGRIEQEQFRISIMSAARLDFIDSIKLTADFKPKKFPGSE